MKKTLKDVGTLIGLIRTFPMSTQEKQRELDSTFCDFLDTAGEEILGKKETTVNASWDLAKADPKKELGAKSIVAFYTVIAMLIVDAKGSKSKNHAQIIESLIGGNILD